MNKEITFEGSKISYRVIGQGKPVVLIHGFAEDSEIWKNQVDYLKEGPPAGRAGFQLIIPDLPGTGKSTMGNGPWTMDKFAEGIKAILDKEAIAVCSIIGHSMGGYITLAFAEKFPGYLNGFGLFHSSAFADNEEKKATRRKGIEFIKEHGAYEFLKTAIPNLFAPNSKTQIPGFIEDLIAKGNNFSPGALVSYYEAMMQRPDRVNTLKLVKLPILFIMGEFDNAIPLQDGLKQCHLPDLSYIHILRNSGHMGMIEEAEKSNRLLEEFLLNL